MKPLIERALKAKLSDAFFRFEGEALASASIAQVHRAVLKDGTDVVVKVQHPGESPLPPPSPPPPSRKSDSHGSYRSINASLHAHTHIRADVARLLGIDLRNIQLIFAVIAMLEPDYDFTMVAKE